MFFASNWRCRPKALKRTVCFMFQKIGVAFILSTQSGYLFAAEAGISVQNATIIGMSSTSQEQEKFWVRYQGGAVDLCNGKRFFDATKTVTEGFLSALSYLPQFRF